MLNLVKIKKKSVDEYKSIFSDKKINKIKHLSKNLRGLKVFHVNSAPKGGGVAEILRNLVPLMRDLGLDARWYSISADKDFFEVTKKIHNCLQGDVYSLTLKEKEIYIKNIIKISHKMEKLKPDVWVIHDPQPAGVSLFLDNFSPAISHIHIDSSSANKNILDFLSPLLNKYDKKIFSSSNFVKKELENNSCIFQPAIDAFSLKNREISLLEARKIVEKFGINCDKSLIAQVSRFDLWKDPLGVLDVYKKAKKSIPDLQLALLGFIIAQDDPEAEKILKQVKEKAANDPDIFIFHDPKILKKLDLDIFVNAIQRVSDIILQKSIREGFGLTVTEAMWKSKVVIANNVGGIKTQIKNKENGFLVSNSKQMISLIIKLIKNKKLQNKIGRKAKLSVKNKFLMTRLLEDYLKLIKKILKK